MGIVAFLGKKCRSASQSYLITEFFLQSNETFGKLLPDIYCRFVPLCVLAFPHAPVGGWLNVFYTFEQLSRVLGKAFSPEFPIPALALEIITSAPESLIETVALAQL